MTWRIAAASGGPDVEEELMKSCSPESTLGELLVLLSTVDREIFVVN